MTIYSELTNHELLALVDAQLASLEEEAPVDVRDVARACRRLLRLVDAVAD